MSPGWTWATAFGAWAALCALIFGAIRGRRLKLKRRELLVQALADGPLRGVDLRERVVALSGGEVTVPRGLLYVLLADLEEEGLVESLEDPAQPGLLPRRRYRLATTLPWGP